MDASISVFQQGINSSIIQLPSETNPLDTYFAVDINITNPSDDPIWGWNIGVNWNATVLQLSTIIEGNYLTNVGGIYAGSPTLFIAGPINNVAGNFPIDNVVGTVDQGISDLYLTNTTTAQESGSLCILTFEIINYGNSYINITAGLPTLIDNFGNSIPVTINNGEYVSQPRPPPISPIAIIHNRSASTNYLPGSTIDLDAYSSQCGSDPIPNPLKPVFPITSFVWNISSGYLLPTGFNIPTNGVEISFIAPNSTIASFILTLTVTTPTDPADPNYINTNTSTIEFDPASQQLNGTGAQLNVYIVNSNPTNTTYPLKFPTNQGFYNDPPPGHYVDTFAPNEIMNIKAFVLNNGFPEEYAIVTFFVTGENNPSDLITTLSCTTDVNGYAVASFRLPNYDSGVMLFGNYTVTATIDVNQVVVSDCFSFQYNWILTFFSAIMSPKTIGPDQSMFLTASIQDNSFDNQNYYLTFTVTDANEVAITFGEVSGITTSSLTTTGSLQVNIPTYAFSGTATLHLNIFNSDPVIQTGTPYCPEYDVPFTIANPP